MEKMNGGDLLGSKDPAIKLFGRKIPLPESQIPAKPKFTDIHGDVKKAGTLGHVEGSVGPEKSSPLQIAKEENQTSNAESKEEKTESNGADQERVFKKPDKIIPCPRCNSLDTKFCYFNNYNVNQPRHFCKNCQRYWTAGGTMRNVPVGAGRRKNKQFASQYRQILVSPDGVPMARIDPSDLAEHQILSPNGTYSSPPGNGTVLKFGPETPLCESMDTVLKLGEQKKNEHEAEHSISGSSVTASSCDMHSQKEQNNFAGTFNDHQPQQPLPFYPVPPWGFPLSSVATVTTVPQPCLNGGNNPNLIRWGPGSVMAVPGVGANHIPLQFVPASYYCRPIWASGMGHASGVCLSPSSSTSTSCCSGGGSPTLGKHSRDPVALEETQSEKCVVIPKTFRIDEPAEAARSPIRATLGIIQSGQGLRVSNGFKTFEPKAEGPHILQVNPAALSRSHAFQEST